MKKIANLMQSKSVDRNITDNFIKNIFIDNEKLM